MTIKTHPNPKKLVHNLTTLFESTNINAGDIIINNAPKQFSIPEDSVVLNYESRNGLNVAICMPLAQQNPEVEIMLFSMVKHNKDNAFWISSDGFFLAVFAITSDIPPSQAADIAVSITLGAYYSRHADMLCEHLLAKSKAH